MTQNEKINGDTLFHMLGVRDYQIRVLEERIVNLEKELQNKKTPKPLKTDPVE